MEQICKNKDCAGRFINYGVNSDQPLKCPACGEEMVEEYEKYHRMINIILEKVIPVGSNFSFEVAEALREYADKIENATDGEKTIRKFKTKNGCKIQMIHGLEAPVVKNAKKIDGFLSDKGTWEEEEEIRDICDKIFFDMGATYSNKKKKYIFPSGVSVSIKGL